MENVRRMDIEKSEAIVTDNNIIGKESNNLLDDLDSEEEYEENITIEKEWISCEHSSLITDKYRLLTEWQT